MVYVPPSGVSRNVHFSRNLFLKVGNLGKMPSSLHGFVICAYHIIAEIAEPAPLRHLLAV